METLRELQSLGLELPSPAYLAGALMFGMVGWVAYRHGRRSGQRLTLWLGVALMLFPYAVSGTGMLYAIGTALCAAVAVAWRR